MGNKILSVIIQMLFLLVILYFILGAIVVKFNIPSVKVMLLGIALIAFLNILLIGDINSSIGVLIAIIGLSLCIVVFLKEDK